MHPPPPPDDQPRACLRQALDAMERLWGQRLTGAEVAWLRWSEQAAQCPRLTTLPVLHHFFDRRFLHYLWTGAVFTLANIGLLWLCIDVWHWPTLLASSLVIGGLFLLRYLCYRWLGVL
jgi:hypothetical protein